MTSTGAEPRQSGRRREAERKRRAVVAALMVALAAAGFASARPFAPPGDTHFCTETCAPVQTTPAPRREIDDAGHAAIAQAFAQVLPSK